ncbi:MAG: DUF5522 domain-containing protein [bacterium]|nr:DUF5522 domain-containing protein [bacterium]
MKLPLSIELIKLHEEACQKKATSYIDPKTGYAVFTRVFHEARGYCCKSGCRHCPYGFFPEPFKK